MPPGWVFGAAWTTLYLLLGIALALILHARGARGRGAALALFASQLLLNFAWSPMFFALHEVRIAFFMIVAIILLSIAATFLFARIRTAAALLMLPYLLWLAFAGYLTLAIDALNPDAAALAPPARSADILI